MSVINGKKIIGIIVKNEADVLLGKVYDFEIDINSQIILKYYIKGEGLIKKFTTPEIVIYRNQVKSITKQKMIVDDISIKNRIQENSPAIGVI